MNGWAYLKQYAGWRRVCSGVWWVGALVRRRRMEGVQETQTGGVLHPAGLEPDSWASEGVVGWSNWAEVERIRGVNHQSDPNKAQSHNNLIKHSSTQWFRCGKWVKSIMIQEKINKRLWIWLFLILKKKSFGENVGLQYLICGDKWLFSCRLHPPSFIMPGMWRWNPKVSLGRFHTTEWVYINKVFCNWPTQNRQPQGR